MLPDNIIRRISQYPVFAIKLLFSWSSEYDHAQLNKIKQMNKIELMAELPNANLTDADANQLFREYRYLTNPSLKIYLLPSDYTFNLSAEMLKEILFEHLSKHCRQQLVEADFTCPQIVDYATFADIIELRLKYTGEIKYLNIEEEAVSVTQTLYGFVWFNFTLNYSIIMCTNQKIIDLILGVIASALGVIPRAVRFPRNVADSISRFEDAKRFSHLDPSTGIRYTIAGEPERLLQRQQEIQDRGNSCQLTGSLSREVILNQVIACLGCNAKEGQIYLTKILPTQVFREWAAERLKPIIGDLRLYYAQHTDNKDIEKTINKSHVTNEESAIVADIVNALLELRDDIHREIPLDMSSSVLLQILDSKFFQARLYLSCTQCDEGGSTCPYPDCNEDGQRYRNDSFCCLCCKRELAMGIS